MLSSININYNCSNPSYLTYKYNLYFRYPLSIVLELTPMKVCTSILWFNKSIQASNIASLLSQDAPETKSIQRPHFLKVLWSNPVLLPNVGLPQLTQGSKWNCSARLGREATDDCIS